MDQDRVKGGRRLGWVSDYTEGLVALAGRIGLDTTDSHETALQKRLVVVLCAGTLPLTVLWSAIYLAAGVPLAAAIPGFYSVITPINTAIFAWTRNLGFYRFTQLLTILILPWLLTMCLGGFRESSVVIIWAALCPLGSLLLEDLRRTLFWIVGFVVLLIVSALLQPHLVPVGLPEAFVTWFFVLNVGSVIAITFGLLYYFVGRRNFFQQRSEMLLLNILPKEISEALKADQRTIAAEYDAASILFADVVEFTPMAAKMTPLQLVDLLMPADKRARGSGPGAEVTGSHTNQFPCRDCIGLTLQTQCLDGLSVDRLPSQRPGALAEQDLIGCRSLLESRSDIDGVSGHEGLTE